MAALFLQIYENMLARYSGEFAAFTQIHNKFQANQSDHQVKSEFDRLGQPILLIVQRAQNDLCRKMENTHRGKYSANLSDKFMQLVRRDFPLIDLVGVTLT